MIKRQKFDFSLLQKYCSENSVTLLEDYSNIKLTKDAVIKGKCIYENCNCNNSFEKKFSNLTKTGAYCKECIKIVLVKKIKNTFLQKYGSENILQLNFVASKTNQNKFNFEKLQNYCKENNLVLLSNYSNINLTKKNIIKTKCQTLNCCIPVEKIFREIEKRGAYCKECMNKLKQEKTKNTCFQKYGVEHVSHCNEYKEKCKQTSLEKYGVEYPFQSNDVKSKIKETNLKNLGVEHPTQCEEVKNRIKETNIEKYGCETTLHSNVIKEKVKITMIKKYGVENASQSEEVKNKKIETSLNNWGVKYPSQNKIIQNKVKETNLKNLGVEYPTQCEEVKNKIKETNLKNLGVEYNWQNEDVKNKIKETNLKNLGVEYPSQSEEVKNKVKKTNLKNLGVEYPSQNVEIKNKIKETNLNKYGYECTLQNEEVKQKTINTNLLKYGVEYPIQNKEIMHKHVKSSYCKKEFIFPSGKIELVQGYEPFALNDLIINDKINESDIIVGVLNVPEIWFYDENNEKHRYYVDIYIPSQNKCIEVKSLYTYNDNINTNLLKESAALKMGYKFEFWIYNNKGQRIN